LQQLAGWLVFLAETILLRLLLKNAVLKAKQEDYLVPMTILNNVPLSACSILKSLQMAIYTEVEIIY